MTDTANGRSGHRLLPHTADLLIDAWADTEPDCIAEAVRGLADSFVDVPDQAPRRGIPIRVHAGTPAERLVAVLEEAVFLVDAQGLVPVGAGLRLDPDDDEAGGTGGEVRGRFDVVALSATRPVGPAPKGITRHGLRMSRWDGGWRGQVVVDV
ncbi:MAG TPA: archease [Pseudonocardiaceae bacterium]